LPQPSTGDIFVDVEGDPFVAPHGLEYLTGVSIKSENGGVEFDQRWALHTGEEKTALEVFIDFALARVEKYPGAMSTTSARTSLRPLNACRRAMPRADQNWTNCCAVGVSWTCMLSCARAFASAWSVMVSRSWKLCMVSSAGWTCETPA
jgi:hypothetical protein